MSRQPRQKAMLSLPAWTQIDAGPARRQMRDLLPRVGVDDIDRYPNPNRHVGMTRRVPHTEGSHEYK